MKYAPYLLIALVVGILWFQHREIKTLSSDLGTATEKVEQLKKNQEKIESDLEQFKSDQAEHDKKTKELDTENRTKKTSLDKLKGRESTISKKASLTEKMINDSFKKSADELSCSTGATERCAKQ